MSLGFGDKQKLYKKIHKVVTDKLLRFDNHSDNFYDINRRAVL